MNLLDELFSRSRAEVLRQLFGVGGSELHFRELVRRSGLSVGTMQAELAKLAAAGLVRGERDGNRLYYRAEKRHPAYGALRVLVRCSAAGTEVGAGQGGGGTRGAAAKVLLIGDTSLG